MIFKTWLTGLNDVQKSINNISTLSTTANGATHLFSNSAVVQQYASALNGLNKEQALLALSYKNLSTQQKEQILAQMGLIASENTIQSELLQTTLAQKGVSDEKSKAILIELGLMNQQTGELLTQKACTKADLEAILAQKGITGAQAEGIISALGLSGANIGLTASFGLLAKAIWGAIKGMIIFLATNPIGWAILATGATAGLVAIYNSLTTSLSEAQENLEDSISAFNKTTDEINSLNKELKTTEERIRELQKLSDSGEISVADEAELELLKEQNKELARQIALKQRQQITEGKQALEDAQEVSTKTVKSQYEFVVQSQKEGTMTGAQVSVEKELQLAMDEYERLKKELAKDDLSEDQRKNYEDMLSKAESRVDEMYNILSAERQAYLDLDEAGYSLDNESKERLKDLNEIDDTYLLWNHTLTQTKESFASLNAEQQRSILLNRLLKQGLSETDAQSILGSISDTDLAEYWDKDFSFTPPVLTDYTNAEEYGKAYVEAWLNGVKTGTQNLDGIDVSFIDALSQVNDLSDGFKQLGEAYSDVKDKGNFDFTSLFTDDFKETFSGFTEEYENLIKTISESPDNIDACQSAFNNLATAYINSSDVLKNVTEETKASTIAMLKQMGVTNATALVEEQLIANKESLVLKEQFLIKYGKDLKDATIEETKAFLNQATAANATTYALFNYQLQEQVLNDSSLDIDWKIQKLAELATAYGFVGVEAEYLNSQEQARLSHTKASWSQADLNRMLKETKAHLSAELSGATIDFSPDISTSKAETDYADLLEKETTLLEKQLETGIITFKEYTDKRQSIIEDYYKQGLISAEDYYSALEDMYDYQLSLYDKVINAVNYRIEKEIDALEKEKESIEDTYNLKIKLIQTEIDELEKAREKREQQVALEKALYEVEEARRNRDVKLYSGSDRGVIYTNDNKELRETEENLENEKYESHISKLEEQIESLEEEMEKATDAIDEQIESLREYADDWSDVADAYEHAQNDMIATQILGANYEEEILNKRRATLEIFKNDYIAAQNAMAEANRKVYESQVNNKQDEVVEPAKPKHYNTRYKVVVDGKTMADYGNSYTAKVWMKNNAPSGTIVPYQVPVYTKGGVIGTKKSPLDSIAQSLGEDHLVAGKEGERFLTPVQNEMWEKWTEALPNLQNFANMLQYNIPNYNLDNIVLRNNTPSQIVNIGDIHLHEVQNVPDFAKALQKHLPNISVQYNGKH